MSARSLVAFSRTNCLFQRGPIVWYIVSIPQTHTFRASSFVLVFFSFWRDDLSRHFCQTNLRREVACQNEHRINALTCPTVRMCESMAPGPKSVDSDARGSERAPTIYFSPERLWAYHSATRSLALCPHLDHHCGTSSCGSFRAIRLRRGLQFAFLQRGNQARACALCT